MGSVNRAHATARDALHRVEQQGSELDAAIQQTRTALEAHQQVTERAYASGEPVAPLREKGVALRVRLEQLKAERGALGAVVAEREADLRDAERALYTATRITRAQDAQRIVETDLLPSLRVAVEAVETLNALDREDAGLRYALAHDLGVTVLEAEVLYAAGIRPSELWEWLRNLTRVMETYRWPR